MSSIESRMSYRSWSCSLISCEHIMSFRCPVLDLHLTTHHSNISVGIPKIRQVSELGPLMLREVGLKHMSFEIVLRSTSNHTPLKYRCPFKMSNWIRFAYLNISYRMQSKYNNGVCYWCFEVFELSTSWVPNSGNISWSTERVLGTPRDIHCVVPAS